MEGEQALPSNKQCFTFVFCTGFVFLYVFIFIGGGEERLLPVTNNYLENGSTGYVKNDLFVHYYYSIYVNTDNPGT